MTTQHRGRRITIVVVVLLLAVGVGIWWRYFHNTQKPVDVKKVVHNFEPGSRGGVARNGEPTPGVYLYTTEGHESVSALGGQTNTYPATTTLTVIDTPCGVDTRWDVLTNRSDLDHECHQSDGAWTRTGTETTDQFFNQSQVDIATCAHLVELVASPKIGSTTTGRCTTGANFVDYVYRIVDLEPLTIGGTKVDAVHLRITSTQGGQRSGGGTEDRWLRAVTNLVLRARVHDNVRSPSPVGAVTYKQDYEITMKSLTPER